jgi:D-alanyl-lipoteichoic acid acyltransferase DltB (MBOAT superfamily)
MTRRRVARGRAGFAGRNPSVGAFVSLLMVPLSTTMFTSGRWHGAGYGFVIWGLINGVYLVVNHGWRVYAAHRSRRLRPRHEARGLRPDLPSPSPCR